MRISNMEMSYLEPFWPLHGISCFGIHFNGTAFIMLFSPTKCDTNNTSQRQKSPALQW